MSSEMEDREVVAWVARKVDDALNDADGDLSSERQTLLNYYRGQPYGDERRGYSKVVTREGFEAVEWAMPVVLKALAGDDRCLTFDPVSQDDVEAAQQETDYVRHVILKQNDGFLALHHWFKDSMLYPNGYVKVMVEEKIKRTVSLYRGLTAEQMVEFEPDEYEILEQRDYLKPIQTPMGEQMVQCFDVRVRCKKVQKRIVIEPVPPDQVLVDKSTRDIDIDKAPWVCHRLKRTKTELLDMGYDPKLLDQIGTQEDHDWNDEVVNRLFREDENPQDNDEDSGAMREYWVHECYGWIDYDGDGVAEYRRLDVIGDQLFLKDEVDYQPLIALSTILMPHQHAGIGLVETVKDLQRVMSTLIRNVLDNIYRINKPRTYVSESVMLDDGSTMDAMLDALAEVIPVRGDPHAGTKREEMTSLVSEILPVIQNLDDRTATRTGIAPQLSLDPSVLQQSTMGAFIGALDKANERVEMIVRIFAETGMRKLMQKVHQLVRQHQDQGKVVQIRGQWVNVDPAEWDEREDITVATGLGFNNKSQTVQVLMQLLGLQREALQTGMCNMPKIYATLEKLMDAVGLNVFEHFIDPDSQEYQPPQPQQDPMAQIAAQDIQTKQMTVEQRREAELLRHQREMAKLQMDSQERHAKIRNTEADTAHTMVKAAGEDQRQLIDLIQADRAVDQAVEQVR